MPYTIKVEQFEGPLELLLNLIEERKLSINMVSLAGVTEGYFAYLQQLETRSMEKRVTYVELSAFLVVASTLMLIKSKSLLPGFQLTKEEEEDIGDLTMRLEEYKRFKALAADLGERIEHRTPLFGRAPFIGIEAQFIPPRTFLPKDLLNIIRALLQAIPTERQLPEKAVAAVISIEKKIIELKKRVQRDIVKSFYDFVGKNAEKTEIIVSFLALLELVKLGTIAAEQKSHFGNIALQKTK